MKAFAAALLFIMTFFIVLSREVPSPSLSLASRLREELRLLKH
jgi:hypothetical protein